MTQQRPPYLMQVLAAVVLLVFGAGCGTNTGQTGQTLDNVTPITTTVTDQQPTSQERPAQNTPNVVVDPSPTIHQDMLSGGDLNATTWSLVSYGPADHPTTPMTTTITAEFADGMIRGSAGCNSYSGQYQTEGPKLTIKEIGQTLMACLPDDLMKQEDAFTKALQAATSYQLMGDSLTISYVGGVLRFTRAQAAADHPLEGTTWQLTTFVTGDIAQSLINNTEINAEFAGGKLTGMAGCNSYFGDYTLSGDQLIISNVGATKIACEEGIMTQEIQYLSALQSAKAFEIKGESLALTHTDGQLVFTGK